MGMTNKQKTIIALLLIILSIEILVTIHFIGIHKEQKNILNNVPNEDIQTMLVDNVPMTNSKLYINGESSSQIYEATDSKVFSTYIKYLDLENYQITGVKINLTNKNNLEFTTDTGKVFSQKIDTLKEYDENGNIVNNSILTNTLISLQDYTEAYIVPNIEVSGTSIPQDIFIKEVPYDKLNGYEKFVVDNITLNNIDGFKEKSEKEQDKIRKYIIKGLVIKIENKELTNKKELLETNKLKGTMYILKKPTKEVQDFTQSPVILVLNNGQVVIN